LAMKVSFNQRDEFGFKKCPEAISCVENYG